MVLGNLVLELGSKPNDAEDGLEYLLLGETPAGGGGAGPLLCLAFRRSRISVACLDWAMASLLTMVVVFQMAWVQSKTWSSLPAQRRLSSTL